MKTLEELLAAQDAIMVAAEGRDLTAEEISDYEDLEAQIQDRRASEEARRRHEAARAVAPLPGGAPPAGARPAAAAQVREALPYNVSYRGGKSVMERGVHGHDFSSDMLDLINGRGDTEGAEARINALIGDTFRPRNEVDRADTDALSPNVYRPDLWQGPIDRTYPLWDMIASGTTDGRSFDVPKYDSSSGLVGPATEGTEPAGGTYVVTDQTVTPTQVWGKVEITRQAARRIGSPALSGILWDQMLREYYEDREAAVATFLATLTAATDINLGGVDASPDNAERLTVASALEDALVGLQFVRGGNRFTAFAVHEALYKLLAKVEDSTGRKLYPAINPMNATGTAAQRWSTLNINGTLAVPAWALGSAGGNTSVNSWLFDPTKVKGWASAPERLDWSFGATVQTSNIPQLSYVTVGIYGDVAFANLDINGVRQVVFDQNTEA